VYVGCVGEGLLCCRLFALVGEVVLYYEECVGS